MIKDNHLLDNFELTSISLVLREIVQIEITLDVSNNGIFNVSAMKKINKSRNKKIQIRNDQNRLSEEEIQNMIKDTELYHEEYNLQHERIVATYLLESNIIKTFYER
ncbi:unnamed protein product [Rotaria sordida]|uniref:Uncharacterized protein n=1 Tax=Rotaria sordida TaxID=392033 RepID=A0A814IW88_9BILA|nr:unnamed protein product [Rotaria sordida]CAF3703479.1 unnamed protein product [Rotaria sordida]CAF4031849.1 unnamed protein product [Rotaria sordida]